MWLNRIIWFVQDHPIFSVIIIFLIALFIYQVRGDKREHEQKIDSAYSPGWWRRKQEREYEDSKDQNKLVIIILIMVIVIVYNLFLKN